jgi:hypothetical protein
MLLVQFDDAVEDGKSKAFSPAGGFRGKKKGSNILWITFSGIPERVSLLSVTSFPSSVRVLISIAPVPYRVWIALTRRFINT